jgi:hypothetical protein
MCNAFQQNRRVDPKKEKAIDMDQVGVDIVWIDKWNKMVMFEIDKPARDYDIDVPEIGKPLTFDATMKKPDGQNEHDEQYVEHKYAGNVSDSGVDQHDHVHYDENPQS